MHSPKPTYDGVSGKPPFAPNCPTIARPMLWQLAEYQTASSKPTPCDPHALASAMLCPDSPRHQPYLTRPGNMPQHTINPGNPRSRNQCSARLCKLQPFTNCNIANPQFHLSAELFALITNDLQHQTNSGPGLRALNKRGTRIRIVRKHICGRPAHWCCNLLSTITETALKQKQAAT